MGRARRHTARTTAGNRAWGELGDTQPGPQPAGDYTLLSGDDDYTLLSEGDDYTLLSEGGDYTLTGHGATATTRPYHCSAHLLDGATPTANTTSGPLAPWSASHMNSRLLGV